MRIAVSCVLLFVAAFVLTLGGDFLWNSRGNRQAVADNPLRPDARPMAEVLQAPPVQPAEAGLGQGSSPLPAPAAPATDQWNDRLQAHEQQLVESESVAVRISAVAALRELAASHPGSTDRVLELLRLASSDADAMVAAAAKDSYLAANSRRVAP